MPKFSVPAPKVPWVVPLASMHWSVLIAPALHDALRTRKVPWWLVPACWIARYSTLAPALALVRSMATPFKLLPLLEVTGDTLILVESKVPSPTLVPLMALQSAPTLLVSLL